MKLSKKFFKVSTTVLLVYGFLVTAAYFGRKAKHAETCKQLEIERVVDSRLNDIQDNNLNQ